LLLLLLRLLLLLLRLLLLLLRLLLRLRLLLSSSAPLGDMLLLLLALTLPKALFLAGPIAWAPATLPPLLMRRRCALTLSLRLLVLPARPLLTPSTLLPTMTSAVPIGWGSRLWPLLAVGLSLLGWWWLTPLGLWCWLAPIGLLATSWPLSASSSSRCLGVRWPLLLQSGHFRRHRVEALHDRSQHLLDAHARVGLYIAALRKGCVRGAPTTHSHADRRLPFRGCPRRAAVGTIISTLASATKSISTCHVNLCLWR
jgi:hypothetical protein